MSRVRLALLCLVAAAASAPADGWATYRGDPQRTAGDGKPGPSAPRVLWAMKSKEHFVAAPVAHGDRLFVSGLSFINTSIFYSLDTSAKADKRVLWTKTAPLLELPTVSSPAVAGNVKSGETLIFGDGMHQTNGASLYGLDLAKGSLAWQLKVDGTLVHLEGSPTLVGGKVYLGGGAAGVLCVDPSRMTLDGKEQTAPAIAKQIEA